MKTLIRRLALCGLTLGMSAAAASAQQAPAAPQPLAVKQVKPNVYWVEGGGGNAGFVIGTDGVIVIDAKTTPAAAKEMLGEIAKITPKPITHVILTHSDGDHVNGLTSFPSGLVIIAHAGDKKELDAAVAAGARGLPPMDRMPNKVVTQNKETMTIDGVKLELYHWAPAHTSGDLTVFLPDQKIVFTGDLGATNRPSPNIHFDKEGSADGWLTSMKGIVALDADVFVPGHGDVQTKAFNEQRLKDLTELRAKVAALVKAGKSLADIKVELKDHGQTPGQPAAPTWIESTYKELTEKRG